MSDLRYKIILAILLNFYGITAKAQDYVIFPSGDKLAGTVIRNFDYNNYSSLIFRDESGQRRKYSPEAISGFELASGRYFISKVLPGKDSPEFVQRVFSGTLNLDHINGKYYVETPSDTYELKDNFIKTQVEGMDFIYNQKPFIGMLQMVMAGNCGTKLNAYINGTKLHEDSLIALLIRYHECESLPYTVHVEKIPLLKLSPVIMVGHSDMSIIPHTRTAGRKDAFEKRSHLEFSGLLRLHSFRKAPKTFLEIGAGYRNEDNALRSQLTESSVDIISREEFLSSSWFYPFSINFHLIQSRFADIYLGGGGTYWRNKFESQSSRIDLHQVSNIYLLEQTVFSKRRSQVGPVAKLGANIHTFSKLKIVAETKVEYMTDHHRLNLLYNRAIYNQLQVSFSVGVQY